MCNHFILALAGGVKRSGNATCCCRALHKSPHPASSRRSPARAASRHRISMTAAGKRQRRRTLGEAAQYENIFPLLPPRSRGRHRRPGRQIAAASCRAGDKPALREGSLAPTSTCPASDAVQRPPTRHSAVNRSEAKPGAVDCQARNGAACSAPNRWNAAKPARALSVHRPRWSGPSRVGVTQVGHSPAGPFPVGRTLPRRPCPLPEWGRAPSP